MASRSATRSTRTVVVVRAPFCGAAAGVVSLHPPGYVATSALATNGSMQVGFGGTAATDPQWHALLWSGAAGSVKDLHSLLPPEFARGSSVAHDIDAEGNVVGLAQRPDGSTVAVQWRRVSGVPEHGLRPKLYLNVMTLIRCDNVKRRPDESLTTRCRLARCAS